MTVQGCADRVRMELGLSGGFPGWTSYRFVLGMLAGCVEVEKDEVPRGYVRMRSEVAALITIPHHLRGRQYEEVLWEEIGHYMGFRFGLAGQMPASHTKKAPYRLEGICDDWDEQQAARWVRAFLLPAAYVLQHAEDLEHIQSESGCSREMIIQRFADLR